MRKQLVQEVVGHRIPRYVCEILTNNYSQGFLKMSIIKNDEKYIFSYDTGFYTRLERNRLLTPAKIFIVRELFRVNETNQDHLIPAEMYLIEPELVFTRSRKYEGTDVRLMFYPDASALGFADKIIRFMRSILNLNVPDESEVYHTVKELLDNGDYNGAIKYLDSKTGDMGIKTYSAV